MTTAENSSDFVGFTIAELAELSGVEPRTIRSYVEKGLIPGPDSLGRAARYPQGSLDRLRVLQLLRDANRSLTLDQIRMLLQSIGPSELSALADGRMRIGSLISAHATNEPERSAAIDYLRSLRGDSKPLHDPATGSQLQDHVDDDQLPVLEEAARALAKLAGLSTASRSLRGEHWYRLPLTPDIELSVRGNFGSDQLAQFHRIGDALRLLLTKGLRK